MQLDCSAAESAGRERSKRVTRTIARLIPDPSWCREHGGGVRGVAKHLHLIFANDRRNNALARQVGRASTHSLAMNHPDSSRFPI